MSTTSPKLTEAEFAQLQLLNRRYGYNPYDALQKVRR